MSPDVAGGRRSVTPPESPIPSAPPQVTEAELLKTDKAFRRYAGTIERTLGTWEKSPEEWADYIAFLSRLLKAIQSHPKNLPLLPHSATVASRLAQCLSPTLPSGVHQKALEVYTYVFSTLESSFLAAHLSDFLPGLSAVLSFASLSVRPALYTLYEEHIICLSAAALRPPLKSILLSLLPALEEETAEDFDRALRIVQNLEQKFGGSNADETKASTQKGFFWQCLFLCIITSPSRRQGALNYANRFLPEFIALASGELSPEAEALISPEPGLLIRSFIAGLADQQSLVQRGYLDLVVSHLPLNSPIFSAKVRQNDTDKLVSATISILLRKDMSLNRRLWSWFLGPDPKDNDLDNHASSPLADSPSNIQYQYFAQHGKIPLERTILAMFRRRGLPPHETARPFRIALSLMDRWEIGGSLVPRIFLPAIEMAYSYSQTASRTETSEVLRSASLFFDGIEAALIWANLVRLLRSTLDGIDTRPERLHLFVWVIQNFNVKDEEMVTVHIPCAALYLLSLLNIGSALSLPEDVLSAALSAASILLNLTPARASQEMQKERKVNGASIPAETSSMMQYIRSTVVSFYDGRNRTGDQDTLPFPPEKLFDLLAAQLSTLTVRTLQKAAPEVFCQAASLLLTCASKQAARSDHATTVYQAISASALKKESGGRMLPFPVLQSEIQLAIAFKRSSAWSDDNVVSLEPALSQQAWHYLSSQVPKYHVEAVRSLWQIDELVAPSDALKASILTFMTEARGPKERLDVSREEAVRRFTLLWNLSLLNQTTAARRSSGHVNQSYDDQAHRTKVLTEPLFLALEALEDDADPAFEVVNQWLRSLQSLPQVLSILLNRLAAALDRMDLQTPNARIQERHEGQRCRELHHTLTLIRNLFSNATKWTWRCLGEHATVSGHLKDNVSGVQFLVGACLGLAKRRASNPEPVRTEAVNVLQRIASGFSAPELKDLNVEEKLLDLLVDSLEPGSERMQAPLLQLTMTALQMRSGSDAGNDRSSEHRPAELQSVRPLSASSRPGSSRLTVETSVAPPPQLLNCLRQGFGSRSSWENMESWLRFLSDSLPLFEGAIFSNILPLTETICRELDRAFSDLVALSTSSTAGSKMAPDVVILNLLEGLEMLLAHGHDSLIDDAPAEDAPKAATPSASNFFGTVASGVFKTDSGLSKMAPANNRLTIILAFQDAVRLSLTIWIWATHGRENSNLDKTSAATSSHTALRVRNKTRLVMEHIFAVEPLEALEVLIAAWKDSDNAMDSAATLNLLQVMHGSRPKTVVPAILDSLCGRTNSSALTVQRLSSKTADLAATDVAMFLAAYLRSMEDDAMDEIWTDCTGFLKDVLSNPLPYRQVLAILLSVVLLLSQKANNTNFGDQRKMRRDLSDLFQRLLVATFTALPSGYVHDAIPNGGDPVEKVNTAPTLSAVLIEVVKNIDSIVETSDRVNAATNSISTNVIGPSLHAKSFPRNISAESLSLILEVTKKAPNTKLWKKDVSDAFYDPKLFQSAPKILEQGWFPIIKQWALRDKEHMTELLGKLIAPSSAGIMFGVGASAARHAADRNTQYNLRRLCVLLLSAEEDVYANNMADFQLKVVELFEASQSSSPSSTIKAELFMVCRALLLSHSGIHLASIWPIINDSLRGALTSLMPDSPEDGAFTNLGLLQACKLLDLCVTISPDDFQLHEWLYITDTIDAVYHPADFTAPALSDQVAESLGMVSSEVNENLIPSTPTSTPVPGQRRPLLNDNLEIDKSDLKALRKDDFATPILRPFLSQLSMLAYEGVYSLDRPDIAAYRENLIRDLLDTSTMVD